MTQVIEIFCRYIRKNGRIIYPKKGKYFHFYVDRKESCLADKKSA